MPAAEEVNDAFVRDALREHLAGPLDGRKLRGFQTT